MTDRPIIFSVPMVRALIREAEAPGTGKTQTRRLLRRSSQELAREPAWEAVQGADGVWRFIADTPEVGGNITCDERYAVGDRLWVREAFHLTDDGHETYAVYSENEEAVAKLKADIAALPAYFSREVKAQHLRLRPSIHMPRWASRLTLHVTDVRVERLQDISEADAIAEGAKRHVPCKSSVAGNAIQSDSWYFDGGADGRLHEGRTARDAYEILWGKLNGWKTWDANPWAVVITFRPILANIDTPSNPSSSAGGEGV